MRRTDKEITDPLEIASILCRATYCFMSLADGDQPYGVPLCFGHQDGVIHLHAATKGKKLDIIAKNPKVCLVFVGKTAMKPGELPCDWTMAFESVIAFGKAAVVTDPEEKRASLAVIAAQYGYQDPVKAGFPDENLKITTVLRVRIDAVTGKRSGGF